MMFQVYAVKGAKPDEWRDMIGWYETETDARNRARQAIASGCDYAYIKQGFETVAYLTESSFMPAPSKPTPATPK